MNPLADSSALPIRLSKPRRPYVQRFVMIATLLCTAWAASAQTITWSESFKKGVAPTEAQRSNWANFLSQIKDKRFASVKIWGSFDAVGISLADPAAATELARLLSYERAGTVTADGHSWTVTLCDNGTGILRGALSVDGNQLQCDCKDKYALRPFSTNGDWGGLNAVSESCGSDDQTINVEFHSGVSIRSSGPTTICNGESVELSVISEVCSGNLAYEWSTGETTSTITVTTPGSYWVSVVDPVTQCGGTASPITITSADVSVTARIDGTDVFCTEPVQLVANGVSEGIVNKLCLFDHDEWGPATCDFSSGNLCSDYDMLEVTSLTSYSAKASIKNPLALRYNLYYLNYVAVGFTFRLNGNEIGTFQETSTSGICRDIGTSAPVVVSIDSEKLKQFWLAGENTVTVEVKGGSGFYLIGITAEVITSDATYSWTPTAGLDRADIATPLASPLNTQLYTVTYTANGCQASASVEVKICAETPPAPIAKCATLDVTLETGCTIAKTADDFNGGSSSPSGLALTYSIEPAGPFGVGVTPVTLTVTDSEGQSSTCSTTITVRDEIAPVFESPVPIMLTNEPGTCSAIKVLPIPNVSDNCLNTVVTHDYVDELNQPKTVFPVGGTTVTWTAKDASGNISTATQIISVTNAAPVITSISTSTSTVLLNTAVIVGVVYDDNNVTSASINWGDGSALQELLSPLSAFEATHAYQSAGAYSVTVTITDVCGATVSEVYGPILVYDRRAGSVNGGGWFDSPPGAYKKDERATGRGSFSFDAKYTTYSNAPVGTASFTFKPGNLKFKSTSFDLLTVNGEAATLTGQGTVNGKPGYKLLIAMVDDDTKGENDNKTKKVLKSDRIRLKISDSNGVVIYDNQAGEPDEALASTRISSGSIEIETTTFQTIEEDATVAVSSFGEEATSVYPNPFTDYLNVEYNTESNESLVVQLMDLAGRVIASGVFPVSEGGSYSLDVPENAEEGIYILKIKQGKKVELLNVVRK